MNINRRHLTGSLPVLGLVAVGLLGARAASAMTADEEAVAKKVEAFRAAQFVKDGKALEALVAADLSYSHSDARVEDKAAFLKSAVNPATKNLSLVYKDPSIKVVGDVAIVRFHWMSENETIADGKKGGANIHVLMNWQKQGGDWKLLSRAATKL
ncbi:MAG: nuclear transport factor 2 family protein [Acetobacteraceae bacterium]|nr:nuclear transport factor 2 family protein [Acetobacteraceae bacterium]